MIEQSASNDTSRWSVRPLGDHFDEYISIASEALLNDQVAVWDPFLERLGPENFRTVWQASPGAEQLVGGFGFYRVQQWIHGKAVPTAGFSAVAISPAARGTGACATMLMETLRELHGEKMPQASLYASTQSLYRSVGFEQAALRSLYHLPIGSLRNEGRDYPVTRYPEPPTDVLNAIDAGRGGAASGVLQRSQGLWDRLTKPQGRSTVTYVLGPPSHPTGYAILLKGMRSEGMPQPLNVLDYVARDATTLARLATLFHDHRSLCDAVRWPGGPTDPLLAVAREQRIGVIDQLISMNRVIHLPAAFEGRGYNTHVAGQVQLDVRDSVIPENCGRWVIEVERGAARVRPGGSGALKMDIRGCAPLLTGYYTASQLAQIGWLKTADARVLATADALFGGPPPFMPDLF